MGPQVVFIPQKKSRRPGLELTTSSCAHGPLTTGPLTGLCLGTGVAAFEVQVGVLKLTELKTTEAAADGESPGNAGNGRAMRWWPRRARGKEGGGPGRRGSPREGLETTRKAPDCGSPLLAPL